MRLCLKYEGLVRHLKMVKVTRLIPPTLAAPYHQEINVQVEVTW